MAVPFNVSLVDLEAHSRRMVIVEADVTGSLVVSVGAAGIKEVEYVFPVLAVAPTVNAMWVDYAIANQTTYPGRITLNVTKPTATNNVTPTASSTSTAVRAIVIGKGVESH